MADPLTNLSPIGFGAFKIGRNTGIKYPQEYDLPDDRTVERLLNAILDLGINYIDTAPAYGASEERIGKSISHRSDEFTLSTKVGESFTGGASSYEFSAAAVHDSVNRSKTRLRTDVLDMVFVHANRDDVSVLRETDVVPTLQTLREAGDIRRIGFSGYTTEGFRLALEWSDAIMVEYHLNDRSQEAVIAEAARRNVAVIVKKGLASGHLDATDAIRFVLSDPAVTSLVIGGLNPEHVRTNLSIARTVREV